MRIAQKRSNVFGETVSAYVAELRKLSEHCEFADTLSDMLRDRLVCGINDQRLQRRLLSEPQLTYAKAFDLAPAIETADRNTKELGKSVVEVHAVRNQHAAPRSTPPAKACYRCGNPKHMSAEYPFKDSDCHHCGKKGHIAKVCRSKQGQAKQRPPAAKGKKYSPRTHRVTADEGDQHLSDEEYTLFSTNDGSLRR